ncbi:metal-dependent hydrolase [Clostridium homopropionicum DSM 5847]|uniref:Metal-dependent hydrolase n=1 Tax=Clostridium homopropionicum DSM 5847 TaxID=1121318 RepID=A0A0L6ZA01_9CLOT|nr:MBL fold metallo-hydrolase [Clostridium homopropionicum]KOA19801.1 metal-dependent hydrolase [Clostridium homopropionicum DSM 5847]SFF77174.1 L-ascorbate metabolism protein UlaG, beta-lactamase superfamily [Clostridium homopropionicum]
MKVQLIRHATLIISLNSKRILVDPMLSETNSMAPIPNVPNQNYNPLVDLPIAVSNIINCDAVLLTHIHRDHFDDAATKLLPKNIPMFCQPEDETNLLSYGFTYVHPIHDSYTWNNITFNRTGGKHGHGFIAKKMAPVSGFIISCPEEPSVYIAGDTIWCKEVEKSIEKYNPHIIICNCGAAQFRFGRPITMTSKDLYKLRYKFEKIKIVAVHMEAWNHCRLSRKDLKIYLASENIEANVFVPKDGEILNF